MLPGAPGVLVPGGVLAPVDGAGTTGPADSGGEGAGEGVAGSVPGAQTGAPGRGAPVERVQRGLGVPGAGSRETTASATSGADGPARPPAPTAGCSTSDSSGLRDMWDVWDIIGGCAAWGTENEGADWLYGTDWLPGPGSPTR